MKGIFIEGPGVNGIGDLVGFHVE